MLNTLMTDVLTSFYQIENFACKFPYPWPYGVLNVFRFDVQSIECNFLYNTDTKFFQIIATSDTTKLRMDVSSVVKTPSVVGEQILVRNVLMEKYLMQDLHL